MWTNTGPAGRAVRVSGYGVWQNGPDSLIANSRGHFYAEDYRRQLEAGH